MLVDTLPQLLGKWSVSSLFYFSINILDLSADVLKIDSTAPCNVCALRRPGCCYCVGEGVGQDKKRGYSWTMN
jgi:hypothetical protein